MGESGRHSGQRGTRRRLLSGLGPVAAVALVVTGCGSSSAGGADGKTITIGLDSVLSGPATSLASLPDGAQAYFDSINAKGGINGYKIKTITVDTAYQGPRAVAVTKQLQNEDVNAVIGIGTVPMTALHAVSGEFHIPIFIGADGSLFVPGNRYFFDVSPDYYRMWAMAMQQAKDYLHAGSVSVVYQNDSVGPPVRQATQAWAKKNNHYKIDAGIAVESGATDCSPQASQLKSANSPVVIIGALGPPTACVMKAASTIGYNPAWITNYEAKDPGETSLLPNSLLHKLYFLDYGIPLTKTANPAVSTYLSTMKQKFPKYVTAEFAQQGWSMGSVMAEAIRMATANGKKFTESALIDALNNGFHGQPVAMLPSVTYNSSQHYSTTEMDLNTYTADGQVKVLTGFMPMPPTPVPGK